MDLYFRKFAAIFGFPGGRQKPYADRRDFSPAAAQYFSFK
jgi:hypothetical protein